jgi:hypothetical protein
MSVDAAVYGLMAEFVDEGSYVTALRRVALAGFTCTDGYSPFPVEDAPEALGMRRTWIPLTMLIAGVIGLITGYLLQYWAAGIAYPINVGGRPLNSWPMFVPITYELTILFASFAGLFGMLIMNGLPKPYHPVWNVPEFARASQDRFFVVIEANDPRYESEGTRRFLEELAPGRVYDVTE